jgi:hypothetical protein
MMGSHMPGTPILPLRTSTIEEVLACVAWSNGAITVRISRIESSVRQRAN